MLMFSEFSTMSTTTMINTTSVIDFSTEPSVLARCMERLVFTPPVVATTLEERPIASRPCSP